jgi:hypothetical protein
MAEEGGRRTIQVFKKADEAIDGCASGTCGTCGSRSSCGEPRESFEEMLTRLYLGFGDKADVEVHIVDPSADWATVSETIANFNRMLEARREDVRVTGENLEEFMSDNVPLIAVDGVLFFVGIVPSDRQMARALEIMSKTSE